MSQETINLGRVACNPMGNYDSATTYNRLDIVSYQNASYICKVNNTINVLPTNTTNWEIAISMARGGIANFDRIDFDNGGFIRDDANRLVIGGLTTENIMLVGDDVRVNTPDGFLMAEDVQVDNEMQSKTLRVLNSATIPSLSAETITLGTTTVSENQIGGDNCHIIADSITTLNDFTIDGELSTPTVVLDTYNTHNTVGIGEDGLEINCSNDFNINARAVVVNCLDLQTKVLSVSDPIGGDYKGRIDFGDKDEDKAFAYIEEETDDSLTIHANQIKLDGENIAKNSITLSAETETPKHIFIGLNPTDVDEKEEIYCNDNLLIKTPSALTVNTNSTVISGKASVGIASPEIVLETEDILVGGVLPVVIHNLEDIEINSANSTIRLDAGNDISLTSSADIILSPGNELFCDSPFTNDGDIHTLANMTVDGTLTIGGTTITEAQLQALLQLINNQ